MIAILRFAAAEKSGDCVGHTLAYTTSLTLTRNRRCDVSHNASSFSASWYKKVQLQMKGQKSTLMVFGRKGNSCLEEKIIKCDFRLTPPCN